MLHGKAEGNLHFQDKQFWSKKGHWYSTLHLSEGIDDDSNCKAGITQFLDGKTREGQMAQAVYKVTLKEEFSKNKLTGTINS